MGKGKTKKSVSNNSCKLKILLAYHKKDIIFKNDFLVPIHVGRAISRKKAEESNDFTQYDFLCSSMIGDDLGENISEKNSYYNEMTAIYWAWKNYDKLGNPENIGFMHYRRHFLLKENKTSPYYESNKIISEDDYIKNYLNMTEDNICNILERNDFICTKPYYETSVYDHFKENHDIQQLDYVIAILKEKFPQYSKACDKYINGKDSYFCNMFIFPKDIFFDYCSYIFTILDIYEKSQEASNKRFYVSERLTGIFIQYLLDQEKRGAFFPTNYLEENIVIPVVFSSSLEYLWPTSVAITSLMENAKKNNRYDIYVLVDEETFSSAAEKLRLLQEKYKNCTINIVNITSKYKDILLKIRGLKVSIGHVALQTYYRLVLPELLEKYNKCIYLDGDTIVRKDLAVLFRTNMDEFYLAGVKAAGYLYPRDKAEKHAKLLGIKSLDRYVNAGVLVFNLKRMREDGLKESFFKLIENNFPSMDQDVLNLACYPLIKTLPYEYNFMTKYLQEKSGITSFNQEVESVFSLAERTKALTDSVIIHFADKVKPWQKINIPFAREWLKYAALSPFYNFEEGCKVSVIIPMYNVANFVSQCIESVLNQSLREIKLIVINDGSTDESPKIVEEYAQKDNRIILINKQNEGVASARNIGLCLAKSEFIAFMDPDDYYPSNVILETLYYKAIEHKANICGGSWCELIGSEVKTEFLGLNRGYVLGKEGMSNYSDYQFDFGFQRFIYSLSFLKNNNITFPNYKRFQDPPFFIKSMTLSKTFYAVTFPTYCYRLGHQTVSNWSHKKRNDQLLGMIDCLRISSRNNLDKLHYYSYQRIIKESDYFVSEALSGENNYILELLIRANSAVNRKLLSQNIKDVNDNFIIKPLKDAIRKIDSQLKETRKEISSLRKSFSFRIGRFITWAPRKLRGLVNCLKDNGVRYTLNRIFKGKK